MLIRYKLKGLTFYEEWFAKDPCKDFLKLKVVRGSRVDKQCFGMIKKQLWTLETDLTLDKDDILKQFTSTIRNEINRAKKLENLQININKTSIDEFLNFYNTKFAKQKKLNLLSKRQIEKFGDNIYTISAVFENELTNIQMYIFDSEQKIVRLLHSVSIIHLEKDKKRRNQIGWINKYLHWRTILYFKEKGFKTFDWGGIGNDPNNKALVGIDKFKRSFGGQVVKVYDYYTLPFFILSKLRELLK